MVIAEIGATSPVLPAYVNEVVDALTSALARRLPAFATAKRKGAIGIEACVRAELLITDLGRPDCRAEQGYDLR